MRRTLERIGEPIRKALVEVGEMATLLVLGLKAFLALPMHSLRFLLRVTVRQVYFTGVQAGALTGLIGFLLGGVVVIQAVSRLPALGVPAFVGDLLAVAILRELGPLVATVIVIGRSGTAIAAELATMRFRGEVEDLESLGIDPIQYLFLPRMLGVVVALFTLMVYFDGMAILGGWVALGLRGDAPMLRAFLGLVIDATDGQDLALLPVKAAVFGVLIVVFACYRGLSVGSSPTEIPRAATGAVVASLLGVFIADTFLAAMVYR